MILTNLKLMLSRQGASLVIGIWALAALTVIGASLTAKRLLLARQEIKAATEALQVSANVITDPLSAASYQQIQATVSALHPGIVVQANSETLHIYATSKEAFDEWRLTIADVMTSAPDARWSIRTLCAGDCQGGLAYDANLTAFRKRVGVKG